MKKLIVLTDSFREDMLLIDAINYVKTKMVLSYSQRYKKSMSYMKKLG